MQYNTATREQYTVLPTVVSLTFYELMSTYVISVMLDHLLGTLFLSVSRTMHCLCITLGTISNINLTACVLSSRDNDSVLYKCTLNNNNNNNNNNNEYCIALYYIVLFVLLAN